MESRCHCLRVPREIRRGFIETEGYRGIFPPIFEPCH